MAIIPEHPALTVFVCAQCARPGQVPTSSGRSKPVVPDFDWPAPAQQIIVPCTGRLQPEHVLKAFEAGSSIVSAVACREDNCHHVEGSRRCARRVDFIRSLLDEIGLGGERLLLFHLPGSASQDLALAAQTPLPEAEGESLEAQIAAIRTEVMEALRTFPSNPLRSDGTAATLSPNTPDPAGGNAHE